jgi:hypothetical protein
MYRPPAAHANIGGDAIQQVAIKRRIFISKANVPQVPTARLHRRIEQRPVSKG